MPAYVIANVDVRDPEQFEEYRRLVPGTLEKYGGTYIVRGGAVEVLEGNWNPSRLVVIEFDSLERARQWHDSQEYAGPMALRHQCADTDVLIVEGV
ncbi:MAG TPA: DUF1330 domain-containing protein [Dehalococcoidia bacterium]|nr:DUF1330 domain-containing protein [Dehalococcoidia bacterium]